MPSSTLKTPFGSLFFPLESRYVYQPLKSFPLNKGIHPSFSGFLSEAADAEASLSTQTARTRLRNEHKIADFMWTSSTYIFDYEDFCAGSSQPTYSANIRLPLYSSSS